MKTDKFFFECIALIDSTGYDCECCGMGIGEGFIMQINGSEAYRYEHDGHYSSRVIPEDANFLDVVIDKLKELEEYAGEVIENNKDALELLYSRFSESEIMQVIATLLRSFGYGVKVTFSEEEL